MLKMRVNAPISIETLHAVIKTVSPQAETVEHESNVFIITRIKDSMEALMIRSALGRVLASTAYTTE